MSHFQLHNSTYNSVEEELWLIFTNYSLHFDPTNPEQWKPATFVKFAKDCQIITSKQCHISSNSTYHLSVPILELEIAKLAKSKSKIEIEKDYSPSSISIDFSDFLSILSNISTKVYKADSITVATRRILLENVLPLANRRSLLSLRFDCRDHDAWKVIKQFSRSLKHIFDYYLEKAEIRRNSWVAEQVTLVSKLIGLGSDIAPAIFEEERRKMNDMKEVVKLQRELISYKEFMQFCQDFSLKSTSFLSHLQTADVYLQVVPLDINLKATKGMSFDAFCEALVYMAHLAYRTTSESYVDHGTNTSNKMKALFLYAWKAINNHDRSSRLMKQHVQIATSMSTPSGTHDTYGSGLFSEAFLSCWQADNFMEYSVVEGSSVCNEQTGTSIIKNLTLRDNSAITSGNVSEIGRDRSTSATSLPSSHRSISPHQNEATLSSSNLQHHDSLETVVLRSSQIANLFQVKPELAEFIYLELQNMR